MFFLVAPVFVNLTSSKGSCCYLKTYYIIHFFQLLMTSTPVPPVPPPHPAAPSGSLTSLTSSLNTSCCENGRPIITDPHTGQSVCSCQYGSGLLSAYSRVPGLGESMYTSPHYPTQGYMPLNTDSSAFYSPLVSTNSIT